MANKGEYGLFIDYEFCTGCKTCVTACKMEHNMPAGDFGISLLLDGPRQSSDGKWTLNFLPIPTHLCDMCEERVNAGKLPTCVHHCQAGVMVYGPVEELAAKAKKAAKSDICIYVR